MAGPDPSVVLVDAADRPLGLMARSLAHAGHGHRHRAFTVLVFDREGRLALARRASTKALWPGAFDGTVASHPRPAEPIEQAARRRLREELGLDAEPRSLGRFDYQIQDGRPLGLALRPERPRLAQASAQAFAAGRLSWPATA